MLSVRTREDELPQDLFGFNFDSGDGEREEDTIHLDGCSGAYKFAYVLKVSEYSGSYMVGGQAYDAAGNVVGRMSGALMDQQVLRKNFYAACDAVSQDLMECSMALFDSKGCPKSSWRAKLKEEFARKGRGGFLYLDEVHLLPAHRGLDLGLDFVEGLLNELRGADMCTLAVLTPFGAPAKGVSPGNRTVSAEADALGAAANVKLARHFARMGFQQVASEGQLTSYWFLCLCIRPSGLRSKAAAASVAVAVPPKPLQPKVLIGKDKELFDACTLSMQPPSPEMIQELVRSGADPDNACALHACAANGHIAGGRVLLETGCNVNQQDEHGNTPLHLAALKCSSQSWLDFVSMLLAQGARTDLKNREGKSPSQCAKQAGEDLKSFQKWEKSLIGSYPVHRAETNFAKKCLHLLDTFVPQPVPKKPRLGP